MLSFSQDASADSASARASTDLLGLLNAYAPRMREGLIRLQRATHARSSSSVIASILKAERKLVDELHGKVKRVGLASHAEHQARPLILASLDSTSRGLARLEAGYRAPSRSRSKPHRGDARKRDFAASVRLFKDAQASGEKAGHVLKVS